ncbi:oligosaccharide flippase family protein [Parasediminibacterium sp. JCM 36343]|uniref:oligosaccharide flippase family protein n=1 Tax=Parasediminibacterium sp. JCM 36343 TaxID=3374279 RepID=UPI003979BE6A
MPAFKFSFLRSKHFLALAGNGVISIFSVVNMALIYRSLDKVQVGTWFFFLTVLGLADAIRNGFLSTATVKFYAGTKPQRAKEVLGSVWFLALSLTSLCVLIDIGLMPFAAYIHNPGALEAIHWFGVTFLSSLPYTITFWILVAEERYIPILWLRMINSGSMILIVIVLMIMGKMSLHYLLLFNFLTNCLTSAACFIARFTHSRAFFKRSKACIIELANFGKFSLATNLSSNLLSSADTFIINIFLGPGAVAVYNLPLRLMEIVEIPLRSFIGTGMSAMAAGYNRNEMSHVAYIFKKYSGMLTWVFIPLAIGAFFFADFAISLLGGGKYKHTEAPNIYRLFMIMAIFYPIDRFNGVTLDIIHLPKVNFYKVLVMLAVCISTDLIGVSIFKNIYGVAFASPFTLLAGILVGSFALRKHIDYSFRGVFISGFKECVALYHEKIGWRFKKH